jgi:signal transduction histidine kinase
VNSAPRLTPWRSSRTYIEAVTRTTLWLAAARWRDTLLAVALCALGWLELFGHEQYNGKPVWPGPMWLNALLIVALTAPFAWRRRRPLPAVLATCLVLIVSTLTLGGSEAATTFIVLIAAMFSGAAYSRYLFVVIAAGVIASLAHGINDPSSEGLADLTWTYGLVAISVIIGRAVWARQHRIGSLESDAATAEARHARQIEAATAAERASIARELHDIVSHAVSVIVIQAQVGSRALPSDLGLVGDSLSAIESSARGAMTELRQLLTLLTADDDSLARGPTSPTASLRHVSDLIEQCRTAGLKVDADIDATVDPQTPMADLAAYRFIQEALTNTMRHAPGASASVRVRPKGEMLELLAVDDGTAPATATASDGAGRGLIGMRERIALAGGRLIEAGHDGNGFRVHALVPAAKRRVGSAAS